MRSHDNRPDGVDTYRADEHDLETYRQAEDALSKLQVPILLHADNPHERLFITALDGTGNSMFKDAPESWSIVARIHKQVESAQHAKIATGYVEGTFTQDNWLKRDWDGLTGYTFERRVETAYKQFIDQSKEWLVQDPQAEIRVVGIGFSRGSEELAALDRLIDQRGIQDPDGASYTYDKDGLVTSVTYSNPALVPPGKTVQASLFLDPVDTGVAEEDRRLPPSVVSALQITAEDERRDLFPASNILKPGFSEDQRFLNVIVGGSHSDIGNTYRLNGIGIRSNNFGIDYINAFSDEPFLAKQAIPEDPELSVIHRSDQHLHGLYTTFGYRDGVRNHDKILVTRALCRRDPSQDCWNKDPIDPALDATLERRGAPIGPLPDQEQPLLRDAGPAKGAPEPLTPGNDTDRMIERLHEASRSDDATWKRESHAVSQAFAGSQAGRQWQAESERFGQALQLREQPEQQLVAEHAQAMQAQESQTPKPPAMRM